MGRVPQTLTLRRPHGLLRVIMPLHPGRRPHLLHPGPDRTSAATIGLVFDIYRFRFSTTRPSSLHAAGHPHRQRRDLGHPRRRAPAPLDRMGIAYRIIPGAYGPKFEFVPAAIGRDWQCGTCRWTSNLPGTLRHPLHRRTRRIASARSCFIGRCLAAGAFHRHLIEHFGGHFPVVGGPGRRDGPHHHRQPGPTTCPRGAQGAPAGGHPGRHRSATRRSATRSASTPS